MSDRESPPPSPSPSHQQPPSPNRRLHVLLIDADPQVRGMLDCLLTASSCAVTVAGSAAQARQAARELGPLLDVVFSPVALPDGDGLRLMTELHDRYGCRTVCMTDEGGAAGEQCRQCAQLGIDRCVPRPTGIEQLRATFAQVVRASEGCN